MLIGATLVQHRCKILLFFAGQFNTNWLFAGL